MKGLAMAGILAAAAVLALPRVSRADVRVGVGVVIGHDARAPRGEVRGPGPAFRYGYDRGWRDGSKEGHDDGRRRRDARYWREGDFRDADDGYRRWMGPRWDYSRGYRDGYADGYRRAYASARPGWRGRFERDRAWERDRDWDRDRDRRDWERDRH